MDGIREEIQRKLDEIEEKENVRILHCAESGSRAWGFASPDSDYDVRFIYIRKTEDYLRLCPLRDVIEWQLDDTFDINGWDIIKALRLLLKSNPTFFEWKNSPVVYRTCDEWQSAGDIFDEYFSLRSGVNHYLNTAKNNYKAYLQGESVKLKKYFYVLRPVLAAKWILDTKTPPPVLFYKLAQEELDSRISREVEELLEMKKISSELGESSRIEKLHSYLEEEIASIEKSLTMLPHDSFADTEKLDRLFRSFLEH